MPYTTLLHEGTRESFGITPEALAQCVVVLDEAHNVVDAVNAMYSCSLTTTQVCV